VAFLLDATSHDLPLNTAGCRKLEKSCLIFGEIENNGGSFIQNFGIYLQDQTMSYDQKILKCILEDPS
jgi:hypothetical protein